MDHRESAINDCSFPCHWCVASFSAQFPTDPCFQGWTIFDNLFLLNGTVFVVSDDPESVPDRKTITSTGITIQNGPEAIAARLPTDREFRVITVDEAQDLFGTSADLVDGTTVRRCSCKCTSSNTQLSGS